jgi:hypothetical protein
MVLAFHCMNHLANVANLLFTQELLLDFGMQLMSCKIFKLWLKVYKQIVTFIEEIENPNYSDCPYLFILH